MANIGIDALAEKLGPIGMVEFIRQFDPGYGDYTKERHTWLDNPTIKDISREIKKGKQHERQPHGKKFMA